MIRRRNFAALALMAMLAIGCGSKPEPAAEATKKEDVPAEAGHPNEVSLTLEALKGAGIKTAPISVKPIFARLEVPGEVTVPTGAHAVLTPPVPGRIVELRASIGQEVRQGQVLAVIQSGDLAEAASAVSAAQTQAIQADATVRQQSAAVDLAAGRLRTAQASLARQRQFAKAGAFSQPSLTAARNEVSEAETEQASAKSDLAGAQTRLARAERLSREGLIARAEYDQANLDVQQAQIRLDRAAERIRFARETFERENRIGSEGLLNAREIQSAEAEVRAARLELDRARVEYQGSVSARSGAYRAVVNAQQRASAARGGSSGTGGSVTLTAPIGGTITEMHATVGQAVERSSDLFDIENLTTVWVTANVPEAEISRVGVGTPVEVTTSAYPGKVFKGAVQLVGAKLDSKTRTLPVQCRVPNPGKLLRSELFMRVSIGTGKTVTTLAVPADAVVGEDDDTAVFVEHAGKYERRKVRLGRTGDGFSEVTEGLKEGDNVVVKGVFVLQSELRKGELKEED